MLYQTHVPLFLPFHPFTSSISPPIPTPPYPSSLPDLQVETEMECEAALKTSFRKDTSFKFSPHAFLEELSALNAQNVSPSDDFSVDDLLDFSHEDALVEEQPKEEEERKDDSVSVSPQQHNQSHHFCNLSTSYSVKDEFGSSELTVPADDEADLEWLSHFVEDSFLEYSTAYPTGTLADNPKSQAEKVLEPETPVSTRPCFQTPVPAKARSKRTRTGVRVWPLGSPPIADSSSSTSSSSSSSSSPSSTWLIYTNVTQNLELVCSEAKPSAAKKPKKKAVPEAAGSGAAPAPRRCSHCGVQKTPQWRTGPLGAKTLCNACGVRYKSGRLLPEYRPACSPTFSSELHSNHHRKVLEMRRKKELMSGIASDLDPPPVVPSF